MTIVATDDTNTIAAYSDMSKLVVIVTLSLETQDVTYQVPKAKDGTTVRLWLTATDGAVLNFYLLISFFLLLFKMEARENQILICSSDSYIKVI